MKLPLVDHAGKRVIFAGPGTGYRMIPEFKDCALCNHRVQLCRVGMLMWSTSDAANASLK